MSPETEQFYNYLRKIDRKTQYYIQNHAIGASTNVIEDDELEEIWLDFQLRHAPNDN